MTSTTSSSPSESSKSSARPLPLAGLRVVEFTHMVMGPTCGMVLADLGAEVIKVEPVEGDRTRHLLGAGAGFFPMFNRNKKSIALDLRNPEALEVARKLAASADVVAQNFKPGVMTKYGLDYAALQTGVERFDACLAGIGGCPHAPGASGNVATEDLAYLLHSMGLATGIDLPALLALRARVAGWLDGECLHGTIAQAGLPRTLTTAAAMAA